MTEEEIKNKISEYKECCKKLAEEYRQRYNEDNADKLALNMFYHNVISYNDFETVLAIIEDRNSMIMCFSNPPILTEETVEVDIKRIEELEKENAELKEAIKHFNPCGEWNDDVHDCEFRHYAIEYGSKLTKAKKIIEKVAKMYRYSPRVDEIIEQAEQFLSEVEK